MVNEFATNLNEKKETDSYEKDRENISASAIRQICFPYYFRGVLILRELLLLFFDRHNTPFDFFVREFK